MAQLPDDFQPGIDDVICGRGKKCYNHIGNERFRVHVMGMLDEYSRAKSKLDKSGVLATVVAQIRAKSTSGGFVKQDEQGRWFEVGDFLAREKTSQAFRDALHERYKSSNVSKKKRRQEEQARASDRFRGIARAHSDGPGIEWLSLSDPSLAAARTGGPDIFQGSNLDALARLNQLSEIRASRFKPQSPTRSHSSLGLSRGMFTDPSFTQQNLPAGSSVHNFPPVMVFSENHRRFESMQQKRYPSSVPASPMMHGHGHGHGMPSPQDVGSQEPLDAYRRPSTAQADLEVFDLASPPQRSSSFVQMGSFEHLHHSMPNLATSDWDPFEFQRDKSMHNSAPDLNYNGEDDDSLDDVVIDEIDPIPFEEFTPRPMSPKKKLQADHFKKPISMTLSPTSPSIQVSADLLACLEKLNGSTIKDNNPFEPLPLMNEEEGGDVMDEERVSSHLKPSAFDSLRPPLT